MLHIAPLLYISITRSCYQRVDYAVGAFVPLVLRFHSSLFRFAFHAYSTHPSIVLFLFILCEAATSLVCYLVLASGHYISQRSQPTSSATEPDSSQLLTSARSFSFDINPMALQYIPLVLDLLIFGNDLM